MGDWKERCGPTAMPYRDMAESARNVARERYWYKIGGYLYDVIDGPDGDDPSLRPNQLMALGLVYPMLEGDHARAALDVVTAKLLTPFGLRTLSPDDPRYQRHFGGDHRSTAALVARLILAPLAREPDLPMKESVWLASHLCPGVTP